MQVNPAGTCSGKQKCGTTTVSATSNENNPKDTQDNNEEGVFFELVISLIKEDVPVAHYDGCFTYHVQ